jgi:hypothetical protein
MLIGFNCSIHPPFCSIHLDQHLILHFNPSISPHFCAEQKIKTNAATNFYGTKYFAKHKHFRTRLHLKRIPAGRQYRGGIIVRYRFSSGYFQGVTTNLYGFYSLTLPKGSYQINFSYVGYETKTLSIDLTENITKDIELATASAN